MNEIVSLKTEQDDIKVEYEVLACDPCSSMQLQISKELSSVDERIEEKEKQIDEFDSEIDRLTNHADRVDYTVAVSCGVITGLIDVFFVGEFDFSGSRKDVGEKFDKLVIDKANKLREKELNQKADEAIKKAREAAEKKGNTLSDERISEIRERFRKKANEKLDKEKSLRFLEKRYNIPSDSVYQKENEKINKIIEQMEEEARQKGIPFSKKKVKEELGTHISDKSHHLDDLTHHPSILGLAASIAQQFGARAVFQNRKGKKYKIHVEKTKTIKRGKERIEILLIGEDVKTKIACGIINWIMHLLSDSIGSSTSARKGKEGMGLPGPIMTLLKEISMIVPGADMFALPEKLYELFTKNQDVLDGYTLDLRSELAIGKELGKQAIPVFINSVLVRSFYFVRHFAQAVEENNGFEGLDFKAALRKSVPFRNRTVVRMLTISLGTFEAIDLGDAAIRAALKSEGSFPVFLSQFVLRVNFVGIGRFAIACGTDVAMGFEKKSVENKRSYVVSELLFLSNSKAYYKLADLSCEYGKLYETEATMHNAEANMWIQIESTDQAMEELYEATERVGQYYQETICEMNNSLARIEQLVPQIEEKNPGLIEDILRRIK